VEYQIGIRQKILPVWVIWMWARSSLLYNVYCNTWNLCENNPDRVVTLSGLFSLWSEN